MGIVALLSSLLGQPWPLPVVQRHHNPVYEKGRFLGYDIQGDNTFVDGGRQWDFTTLDTQNLGRDEVTIVVSNHLPEEASFPVPYLLLVEKGDASK